MAKKKKDLYEDDMNEHLKKVNKYNEGFKKDRYFKTVNPILNIALSGCIDKGVPIGKTIQFMGQEGVGKSILALQVASSFQRQFPDGVVVFIDGEDGITEDYLTSCNVITDEGRIVIKRVYNVMQLVDFMTDLIKDDFFSVPTLIIIDSISVIPAEATVENLEKGKGGGNFGVKAKELTLYFDTFTNKLSERGVTSIVLNHTRTNMELFAKMIPRGGQGSKMACASIIELESLSEKDKDGTLDGTKVVLKPFKSRHIRKLNAKDTRLFFNLHYGQQIDATECLFDIAKDVTGNIVHSGRKLSLINEETGEVIPVMIKDEEGERHEQTSFTKEEIKEDLGFWKQVKEKTNFSALLRDYYSLSGGEKLITDELLENML